MAGAVNSITFDQLPGMRAVEFVVHREPMLLLDRLVAIGPKTASCGWRVREDNEFMVPGRGVPAYTGVEYMAQCIAVCAGACGRVSGEPPQPGMLLGTRHYRASVHYFEVGIDYQVECSEMMQGADGMSSFECRITKHGYTIAEGRLAVLQHQRGV